ncbi:PapD-like protein [Tribonema minus]|uniref:PapD-like protein n=1 Tax=Tribonema minus TaxID=303371 RepID=A0A835YYD8_9STRA|nr:PapD-like protein [Tribonema minus]
MPEVSISPEVVFFSLARQGKPSCEITVSATAAGGHATFKVKTTEPSRYLVQPNQGLLEAGGSRSITIYMVEREASKLLDVAEEGTLGPCKDKFLVQVAPVEPEAFAAVTALEGARHTEEVTRLWANVNKASVKNKRIAVQFRHQASAASLPNQDALSSSRASDASHKPGVPGQAGSGRGLGAGGSIAEEVDALRTKYNDLVTYTANLTEERDTLRRSLEDAKRSLQKEMAARMALESKALKENLQPLSSDAGSGLAQLKAATPPARRQSGIGMRVVLLLVLLCAAYGWFTSTTRAAPKDAAQLPAPGDGAPPPGLHTPPAAEMVPEKAADTPNETFQEAPAAEATEQLQSDEL